MSHFHFALIMSAIFLSHNMRPRSRDWAGTAWLILAAIFAVLEPLMPLYRAWLERVLP